VARAAQAHQQVIDQLFDYDDPAASLDRLNAAAKRAADPEHSVLLTQVARALGLSGKLDDANVILDSVTSRGDAEVGVRVLLERGRLLNSAGEPGAARPLSRRRWQRLNRPDWNSWRSTRCTWSRSSRRSPSRTP
jgi:hypothetical protein